MPYTRTYHHQADRDVPAFPYDLRPGYPLPSIPPVTGSSDSAGGPALEEILTRLVLPVAALDPVEAIDTTRRLGLRERIGELLYQLERRYVLNQSIKNHLKEFTLEARSELLNLEQRAWMADPNTARRRSDLQARLLQIYREGAREAHECWKDQFDLREKLQEAIGAYRMAAWKSALVLGLGYGAQREAQ